MSKNLFLIIVVLAVQLVPANTAQALSGSALPPWQSVVDKNLFTQNKSEFSRKEQLLKLALGLAALLQGKPAVLARLHDLADLYENNGHYSEAEACYVKSIQLTKETYDSPSSHLGLEYSYMSQLQADQKRYDVALSYNEKALDNLRKTLPANSLSLNVVIHNQAWLELECGNADRAEKLFFEAYRGFMKGPLKARVMTGLSANSLAELFAQQKQYEQSEEWYRMSLRVLSQKLGSSPILNRIIDNYAFVLRQDKKFDEAKQVELEYHTKWH